MRERANHGAPTADSPLPPIEHPNIVSDGEIQRRTEREGAARGRRAKITTAAPPAPPSLNRSDFGDKRFREAEEIKAKARYLMPSPMTLLISTE
ncbi:hypothetical protein U1Q18_033065 [Sarracenia purpurea var. burkii]